MQQQQREPTEDEILELGAMLERAPKTTALFCTHSFREFVMNKDVAIQDVVLLMTHAEVNSMCDEPGRKERINRVNKRVPRSISGMAIAMNASCNWEYGQSCYIERLPRIREVWETFLEDPEYVQLFSKSHFDVACKSLFESPLATDLFFVVLDYLFMPSVFCKNCMPRKCTCKRALVSAVASAI